MKTTAVVFAAPGQIGLQALDLVAPDSNHAIINVAFSGVSTGTEKLLWNGTMPAFPGMGYPLVPGYETVGRVASAPASSHLSEGQLVYVPGATCYGPVRGLFGGAASQLAVQPDKLVPISDSLGENGVLIALAATAHHAVTLGQMPELIVGHGVLGRLMARIVVALGGSPTVWETNPARAEGCEDYDVKHPEHDTVRDYRCILDASGDVSILDLAISRLAKRGEAILGGFYATPLSFNFAPAFMREASIKIAAQWQPSDLEAVLGLVADGTLSLDGLITHHSPAADAKGAYQIAFENSACLKMVLNWSDIQ